MKSFVAGTIHVIDDDAAVREALCFMLRGHGLDVRGYSDAAALLAVTLPDSGCIITDYRLPGMDGLELQGRLADSDCPLPVIVMTGHGQVPLVVRAMRAGAVDFLEKPVTEAAILSAIDRALADNEARLVTTARQHTVTARAARLTPREREVMALMVTGQSSKEIGRALGASPRTIDVHRARVLQKMTATSLAELIHMVDHVAALDTTRPGQHSA